MKTISEGQIRAYFLGKLSAAQAESFEEECAASEESTELAQALERELADDYLRGKFSAADKHLFETNYLVTEARQTKLRVARGLLRQISGEKPKSIAAPNSFWRAVFGGQNKFQFAFGGLLLLVVFGGIAFFTLTPGADLSEVAEIDVTEPTSKIEDPVIQHSEPHTQNTPAVTDNLVVLNKPADKNQNLPEKIQPEAKTVPAPKTNGQKPPGLAVFTLLPGTLRDEGEQFITIAPNTKNLSLHLKLPEDAGKYQTYRAVVKPVEDETVYTAPGLKSLSFTIAAEKLENRTYIIFLEGKNAEKEFESVTEYTFRVRR